MSIISEVKCARCDRKYSGVRSRCPYCGARRIGRGKYSEDDDNSKGRMLIGVLVMSVLVVAAGFLLFTTPALSEDDPGTVVSSPPPLEVPDDTHNVSLPGGDVLPSLPPTPDPSPSHELPAPPDVRDVTITYTGRTRTEFTARVNERVPLAVRIEPLGAEGEITWSSSNRSVFEVVPNDLEGRQATVTGVGVGNATLTVSVGGIEATCIVRVRR